jgi:6-phosphogluconolactonase/glucosamine-6-phosphate isomerase/deaminase
LVVSDERHSEIPEELNAVELGNSLKSTALADARMVSPTYSPDLVESASDWSSKLASLPSPDAAILSMAEDGHIASLFPGVISEAVSDSVEICRTSPKPPAERISLSATYLRKIPHRIAVVVGTNKAGSLQAIAAGSELPISDFSPTSWFVDFSAYRGEYLK